MDPSDLLAKYFGCGSTAWFVVSEHSRLVADKALAVARSLGPCGLDLRFIEEAALLHDIGVCRTNAPGIGCAGDAPYILHGIIGREILEAEGLPRHALVCERHIGVGLTKEDILRQQLPLPLRDMVPLTREEEIICFADLFFSKKTGKLHREKTVERVKEGLRLHGEHKVAIFDRWCAEFGVRSVL